MLKVDSGTVGRCGALWQIGELKWRKGLRHRTGLNYGDYIGIRKAATGHA